MKENTERTTLNVANVHKPTWTIETYSLYEMLADQFKQNPKGKKLRSLKTLVVLHQTKTTELTEYESSDWLN